MVPIKLVVKESIPELRSHLSKVVPKRKLRLKFILLVASKPNLPTKYYSKILGITPALVLRWRAKYLNRGFKKFIYPTEFAKVHSELEKRLKNKPFEGYTSLFKWVRNNHLPNIEWPHLRQYVVRNFGTPVTPRKFDAVKINERLSYLKGLKKECGKQSKVRIEMLIQLKQKKFRTLQSLLDVLGGVDQISARTWMKKYSEGGIKQLLENKTREYDGIITREVHLVIERKLKERPRITYSELHKYIQNKYLPDLSYGALLIYKRRHIRI